MIGVKKVDASGLRIEWWARDRMQRASTVVPSDLSIQRAVQAAFQMDPRTKDSTIRIHVDHGIVTLLGIVDSQFARRAATEDAENTTGVWRVENYLWVRPAREVPDDVLGERVRSVISQSSHIAGSDVNVTTQNGAVYLTGRVDTGFERLAAERAAESVSGVRMVRNGILIADDYVATALVPDWVLAERIESQLEWDPYVDANNVTTAVVAGAATLKGTVRTWSAYQHALKAAYDAGATRVIDQLKVRYGPDALRPTKEESS